MSLRSLFPREHGTWAMLLVPWAIGCGVGRGFGAKDAILLLAILAAFLAHGQIVGWFRLARAPLADAAGLARARTRGVALAAVALAAGGMLVGAWRLVGLVPFALAGAVLAAAGLALVHRRQERALPGQVLAAVTLALAAPAAHYVARGVLEPAGLALWAVSAAFSLGGVSYVRMKITAIRLRAQLASVSARMAFALPALVVQVGLVAVSLLALRLGGLSAEALAGFVPVAIQAIVGTLTLDRPVVLKRVGLLSTAHSILFGVAVILLA